MPSCLIDAYAHHMDRIAAGRLIDAAQAAAYPHMGKGASKWINAQIGRLDGKNDQRSADVPHHRTSAMFWSLTDDGKVVSEWEPISGRMLKANLTGVNRQLPGKFAVLDAGN